MKNKLLLLLAIMLLCVSCSSTTPSVDRIGDADSKSSIDDSDSAIENKDKSAVEEPDDSGDTEDTEDTKDTKDTVDTEDTVVSPDVPDTVEPPESSRVAVDEELRLYLDYIDELRKDTYWNDMLGSMSLVFIDDDDVPELVIDRSYPHRGVLICTVSNGAVEAILAEGAGGGINYVERENEFTYIAIMQDAYHHVVCCIEDGKFVTLREGIHDAIESKWYWDGREISSSAYFALLGTAFDSNNSKYTGVDSIRAADMIFEINMRLSDSPHSATGDTRDPSSGLLTSDGAYAIYDFWRDKHPYAPIISRQSVIIEHEGEKYYYFPAKYTYMYYYNVLVHMESGKMLGMQIEDGMDPVTTVGPIDDWYNSLYGN